MFDYASLAQHKGATMSQPFQKMKPRQQALHLIAAYDHDNNMADEQHLVRIARKWLTLIGNTHYAEGVVSDILADFDHVDADEYVSGWRELVESFTTWAKREDYL
jgi:hypothetical protein